MLNYALMPPHEACRGAVKRYIEHGIPPGSFLEAIITNDLKEACARADSINRTLIWDWVNWFYNCAPAVCWGSDEAYEYWLETKSIERQKREHVKPVSQPVNEA